MAEQQGALVRRAQPWHLQRNTLPTARVEAAARTARHPFQIECSAEVRGLEGLARDFQRVGARVDDPKRLQQAQKELAHSSDGMTIWILLTSAGQSPVHLLRRAAADEIVHVARRGRRGGVHDQEN